MVGNSQTKRLLVGKINGLFGFKGMVKIFSYTNPKEHITNYKKLLIKHQTKFVEFQVNPKKQGKTIVTTLDNFDKLELVEQFLGSEVYIDANWLPKLNNEYYYYQLEQLKVINISDEYLGVVNYVFNTGSNSVLAIKNDTTNKEYMVPFIAPYLISVSLENRQIVVDWDIDF